MFGEAEQDDIIGGTSTAATVDGGDTIDGGASNESWSATTGRSPARRQ